MGIGEGGAALAARALRTRWLVRAPIWIYRAGLGAVFGSRMLLLEHTGRKSHRPRHVVLEVVAHPSPEEYVIVSGFGTESQWYRNVQADPRVRVSTGQHRRAPATATLMTQAESDQALQEYAQRRPKAWAKLRATIERAVGRQVTTLPMVRLRLRTPSETSGPAR
jgi:deazaflavin-dependent oxidoreductase (nitroreductase family)